MKRLSAILLLIFPLLSFGQELIESERLTFKLDTVATGLEIPWSFEFISENEIIILERSGKMLLLNRTTKEYQEIEGVPEVVAEGQGGLLDVRVHPNYDKNGWLYFTYSSPKAKGEEGTGQNTTLSRAKLNGNKLVKLEVLFKALPNYKTNHHFGGRITFDNEGHIFLAVGDRGGRDKVQRYDNYRGKVLRLNDDGSVPDDNPYVGVNGYHPEIYSNGHRNPQGMLYNASSKQIWVHEHGPRGGDEINIIVPKNNYGWPEITYGINYNGTTITEFTENEKFTQPLFYWLPSIAPCGFEYVTSDKYPEWQGDVLVGSLKFLNIERLNVSNDNVIHREEMLSGIGRVRTIRQGPDGYIYISAESTGVIVKIVPKSN